MTARPLLLEPTGVSQLMKLQALGPVVRATALLFPVSVFAIRHYEAAVGAGQAATRQAPALSSIAWTRSPLRQCPAARELLATWQQLGMPVWVHRAWEIPARRRPTCASTPGNATPAPAPPS